MKCTNKFFSTSYALLFALSCSNIVIADDTEIFFNTEVLADTEEYQPNVLFIFDTSGSMGWNITTQEAYDPTRNYCTSTCPNTVYVYNSSYDYLNVSIDNSRNSCQAMINHLDNNSTTPVYIGKAANWTEDTYWSWWQWQWVTVERWDDVSNGTDTVECQEDAGVHGIDDTSTDLYAVDGNNGPYSSSANEAISWSSINERLYVSANYHNYLQTAANVTRVKIDVMKEAAIDLVNEFDGLNFGLMRFDGSSGGYVKHHFSDIETDRTNIINNINALTASGNTPLSETLWEAHKYFLGESVEYGTNSSRDPAAVSGGDYNSPVADSTSSCQSNYIVYLTDGTPYSDSGRDSTISSLTTNCSHSDGTSSSSHTCLDELAGYMANHDYNDPLPGVQNVQTYTIGFDIDMELLEKTASNGLGTYHTASSSEELKTAFNDILLDILSNSSTFTAPAVSVNAYNSLQNRNELYYALFEPNKYPRWHGNIKKYTISSDGNVLDRDGQVAIDNTSTGYFTSGAKSYWYNDENEDIADGPTVQLGGAAHQQSTTRNIYTVSGNRAAANISLNATENIISVDNDLITNQLYGLSDTATSAEREKHIRWILGADVDGDPTNPNYFMGDPLHSRPIVVTYSGTQSDPDDPSTRVLNDTLFATTNDGAFHAINTSNGQEVFSFIPPDLLKNQSDYRINDPDGIRRYGLDGPMTIWRQETDDADINIEPLEEDHVYAFFGMRRGGNNYYAMDLTDTSSPSLMWTIFGGIDGTTGFQDMGQSWSTPKLSQVNWCESNNTCAKKQVLFIAGGYDTVHDDETITTATTGDAGAAIYMIDAETKELLWSAGNNDDNSLGDDTHTLNLPMQNSITGDLTVADMDGNGTDDIIFAVDILGHVWRIDINDETTSATDFATGGEIANLTENGQLRRFYTGPTVSLSQKRGQKPFFVITVGSGYTAHPKNKDVTDRLYSIFEYSIYSPPKDENGDIAYTAITNDDLYDVTAADADPANPNVNAFHGFYRDATGSGEKFLRKAITIFGQTIYTSYLPDGGDNIETSCGSQYLGSSRIYSIDFITGKSLYTSQYIDLKHPGIAPEPVVLFIPDDEGHTKTLLCTGTECHGNNQEKGDPPVCEEGNPNCLPPRTLEIKYWRENTQ